MSACNVWTISGVRTGVDLPSADPAVDAHPAAGQSAVTVAAGREPPDFDAWVAARGPALLRFAYLVTGDGLRAEEAVQDALAKAFGHWARVSRADDPEAYVRRMVANADISAWRRFRRREVPVADVVGDGSLRDFAHAVTEEDAMWRLCGALPRRQRAAVVLRFYEDLSDAQIGRILGCAEVTVRSQIHRALATLRAELTKESRNE